MYNPPRFAITDLAWLDWLAEHHAFGALVSQTDGAPVATHLPVLYRRTEAQVVLSGHWARPNPQWHHIEGQRVMFIFQGPHAYVSPRWFADPPHRVPTWNHVTAHVYGTVRLIEGDEELERIVVGLAERFEAGAAEPWTLAGSSPANRGGLRGIVGFELRADSVEITAKLNQNHPEANVKGVIAGLRETGSQEAETLAGLMQKVLERR